MTISKELLSGSTNGRQIKVAATATPGTTIHTAHATSKDELFLFAMNSDTQARKLTIELGGMTAPDDLIEVTLQPEDGVELIVPGIPLTGAVVVSAFAETANVILISGYVNRHS